jgi:hypothetical protein
MAQYLKAKISLVSVGLAPSGHCMELKVTKPQPKHKIQPELDAFLDGLSFLNKSRIENNRRNASSSEEQYFSAKKGHSNPEQNMSKSPKCLQTSGFA